MNSVVVAGLAEVESPNSVYADYARRIKDIREDIKTADECKDETVKKKWLAEAHRLAYGILTELKDETRLSPEKQKALIKRLYKTSFAYVSLPAGVDSADYGYDQIVALYVASRMSMRKIAVELGINVSTVSRHVRKWAEQNAELRGDLTTAREVELTRLDEMLEEAENAYMGPETRLRILDRKYRLMGLYASGPQVIVGIGVQQGQQTSQPRVIEGVARDISDDSP